MKLLLSKREQRVLFAAGALALVIGWVYAAYIIRPLNREAGKLSREVKSARQHVATLEAAIANESALRRQYEQVVERVRAMRALLPAKEEVADVIQDLSTLATQAHVKIETIFPQQRPPSALEPSAAQDRGKGRSPTSAGAAVYEKIMVQIDALTGYHQLGSFLSLVESGARPMRVSSLRIAGNPREPKRHFIKLLIQAYFATSES